MAQAWVPYGDDQAAPPKTSSGLCQLVAGAMSQSNVPGLGKGQWIWGLFTHPEAAGTMMGRKASYATTLAAACQPEPRPGCQARW